MKNQIKKIKATTVESYSAKQIWTAVLRRSNSYRYECGDIYIDCGDCFRFHCSSHDYHGAVQAIVGIGAVEFNGKFSLLEHM